MATTKLTRSKSICILAIVVCCFAILWPKIFLPMLQSALSMSSTKPQDPISDTHSTVMLPPKVREAMKLSRPEEFRREPGRPFQREKIITNQETNKTGGIMGFVMPLYTIGIIIFFLYTMFKMVFKNKSDDEIISESEEPKIPDFKMDAEYRKFVLNDEYDENGRRIKKVVNEGKKDIIKREKKNNKNIQKTEKIVEDYGKDKKENEIIRLQKRLEETEAAMERILKHMNKMSGKLVANGILPSATFYKNDQNIISNLKGEMSEDDNEDFNESNEEFKSDETEDSDDDRDINIDETNTSNPRIDSNDDNENTNFEDAFEQHSEKEPINNDILDSNSRNSIKREMQELHHLKEE